MKTPLAKLVFCALCVLSFAPIAFAVDLGPAPGNSQGVDNGPAPSSSGNGGALQNPLGPGVGLEDLIIKVLQFVAQIGAIVVVFMLVYVGFLFVVARGEPGKIAEARQALMWTVIGALVLLGAVAIAEGIKATVQALSAGN